MNPLSYNHECEIWINDNDIKLEKGYKIASVRACRMRGFVLNIAQIRLVAGLRPDHWRSLDAYSWIKGKGETRREERE